MPDLPSGHGGSSAAQKGGRISRNGGFDTGEPLGAEPAPVRKAKAWTDYVWSGVGIFAVLFACYMLYKDLAGTSPRDISRAFTHIPPERWALAICGTLIAYAALAWYDRIALLHLGKPLDWWFISLTSFTTYALSHNIGASVFSGAAIRYRAYSTKGLSAGEIAMLVALTAFTFTLGNILLAGLVLIGEPGLVARLLHVNEEWARLAGLGLLGLVALYVVGSWLELPPLTIRGFRLVYPRMPIVLRQLIAAPIELVGAASIIYFAMPAHSNPGFFVVLGVFIIAFSAGLISHAPGGLGVFELSFFKLMPGMNEEQKAGILAALFVWRLLYLLVPLAIGLVIVMLFEKGRLAAALKAKADAAETDTEAARLPSNVVRLDEASRRLHRKDGSGGASD
jgi:uncharacterized membrane protein YbhN (UPF0104 family)